MAYHLYDAYGGYYRLDDDWYQWYPYQALRKYGHSDYEQDYYEQNQEPEHYQLYGYAPDNSLEYDYHEGYDYRGNDYYKYGQYSGQSVSNEAMIIVHQVLQDNEVVLFGLTNCSSCGKAMTQLDGKYVPYLVHNIDSDPYIEDSYYLDALEQMSGIRNIPQLFIHGEFYGDGAMIRNGLERGEIQKLCRCGHYSRSLAGNHRLRWHWSDSYANAPLSAGNINQTSAGNNARFAIQKHLQNNGVVLFALTNCDSCTNTESLLIRNLVPFKVYYVDADSKVGFNQYLDTLEALSNNRNLPQLYIRGNYYGDSQKTREGLESGEIQRLCNCGHWGATANQKPHGLSVEAQTSVQQQLRDNKVTLFVFTNCAPCDKTKALLEEHNIPYVEHYIDQDPQSSQDQYFDVLELLSGIRTVPQLFIRGKFYGNSEKAQEGIGIGEVQRLSR